ncbi:putative nucleotidyltransferase with HDIG domain [Dysgonomonas sp. PH5-45]|uniref:HD family phosphohydrolase n=1 Tax=unclassified Dysgonomonas TaxID=2630389 RepID=UPI0024738B29|nr:MULTISPECIES: HDIG domain-containing metalloprotein [unclassified Dysgonomonas]MDH6355667.1 putative nucleotidyltransferase with HDIG domain [Dysgonomonas sp. PH5-45]MDH6388550.1 putative nucleotidyltransferase with HDIG domain [Dysgonomonas sp. PH5-37]
MKHKINIPAPFYFIVAILLITYIAPRDSKFKYSYVEGRPWKYGLLTAPSDFPIYKPDKQIEAEKDSLMRDFQPYYMFDSVASTKAITQFVRDAEANSVQPAYINYVRSKLSEIYKAGIISINDFEQINKSNHKQIKLLSDNVAATREVSSFRTSRRAYEILLEEIPSQMDVRILKTMNLDNYVTANVVYDEERTEKFRNEMVQHIALAEGMVQAGERIIDRGEIVDGHVFNILNSLKKITEEKEESRATQNWLILGQLIMVAILIMALMVYLKLFRPREYNDKRNTIFILLSITVFCLLTGVAVDYKLLHVFVIPFAIPTILIRTFIDSRTAMVSHTIMILVCALMVPFPSEFILLQIPVGYACIFGLKDLAERSQLIRCSFFILLTYALVYTGIVLWQDGDILQVNWKMFLYFLINFVFVMFSYLLVYMCEKVFGFISGVSMVELSNINKPLLLKLSETAPGTFQHSMQVANLAAAAATGIGANASLVRTGAMYHDIGKMIEPAFFTENQSPGMNPHKGLSYKESAKIIISHVPEGVKIAKSYNLPEQIIAFITTHHGKGKAKYFYNSYKNEHPDEEVDPKDFTYPGPNPFSKETAILMMADTVEAASRSLPEYTEKSISALINRLIDSQVEDGLFRNAPITFKEIEKIKGIFSDKLKTIYHTRIAYPELKKEEKEI